MTAPATESVTTLDDTAGACMDDADQSAWKKESSNFAADMAKCGKQCLGGKACVSTCMQKAGGYSSTCGDCMGDVAACTKTHCMLQCIKGDSAGCTACVKKAGCDTDFISCSGVTPPSSVNAKDVVMMAAGACMDDADQAAWKKESPNFAAGMAKCGKQCLGGKAC